MKFAFLIHPLSQTTSDLLDFDFDGTLQQLWGTDPFGFCAHVHEAVEKARSRGNHSRADQPRVVDEMSDLVSPLGHMAEGRLYEIPMDALAILDDPDRALNYMQEAARMAEEWGARILGLGSMTGIVGGRGTYLAEQCSAGVTTGNCLTAYSALQNLYHAAEELDIDLRRETVSVVGIPGSIGSAIASLLAPHCGELLLVGRRSSTPAQKLARQLGGELVLDIPEALSRSRMVISATSTGDCIDQRWLQAGSVVIDVGVPTDVQGTRPIRDDVLILTGGLVRLPDSMPRNSKFLWFQHGMIPSCLGETLVLGLEEREENLSLGRHLSLDSVQEIGGVAKSHGFDFSRFYSFGYPLEESQLIRFHKARASRVKQKKSKKDLSSPETLAEKASTLYGRHINPVMTAVGRSSNFVKTFVRGEGAYVYDEEGNGYLDFVSGFGALNFGHNHPKIVQAVSEALSAQAPGFAQSSINPYAAHLAEKLISFAPSSLEMVFLTNSGTESIEAALKLARLASGRTKLLSCEGGYHGKTLGSLSVTANPNYQRPFEPLLPGCHSVPFGDLEALERALSSREFAAFVVEPLQAEGGMIPPPPGYLREVQSMCRATGTLLVVDEVQTGLGRTGTLFAVEREGVKPDVVTLAKSLGGGLVPVGALLTRRDLWMKAYGTVQTFALHTSTFGGGSLACAAGLAALQVAEEESLPSNAQARGEQLYEGMVRLCERYRCLREVRGQGLLLGLEFQPLPDNIEAHWKAIDPTGMSQYLVPGLNDMVKSFHVVHAMQTLLQAHRVYTQSARSHPLVLRVEPPLTISSEQAERFLKALQQTCEEIDYATGLIDGMIAKTGLGAHEASEGRRNPIESGIETQVPR